MQSLSSWNQALRPASLSHASAHSIDSSSNAKPSLSLVKSVLRALRRAIPEDFVWCKDEVHFRVEGGRVRIVYNEAFRVATDVKLSIEQVLKRAKGALYNLDETYVQTANLLVKHGVAHNSPVTEITLRWEKHPVDWFRHDSSQYISTVEHSNIWEYLQGVRKSFQAHHKKERVDMMEKRDLFFLQFPDRSELFSIVANEDAKIITQSGQRFSIQEARKKGVKGRLVVRCDVFVRSKNPKGWFDSTNEKVDIWLPLEVGKPFYIFSDSLKNSAISNLFAQPIKEIWLKRIRSEVH